jgi:outer membrane protein TolC
VKIPESLLYNLAADMAAPLINKNAIQAEFASANARQIQSLYEYEKTVLGAYLEVNTQISNIDNLQKNFSMQNQQVQALNKAIDAANDLFKAARADYFEVLMTQRDVLEAKLDLIETKQKQLASVVQIYRSLGGGWK